MRIEKEEVDRNLEKLKRNYQHAIRRGAVIFNAGCIKQMFSPKP